MQVLSHQDPKSDSVLRCRQMSFLLGGISRNFTLSPSGFIFTSPSKESSCLQPIPDTQESDQGLADLHVQLRMEKKTTVCKITLLMLRPCQYHLPVKHNWGVLPRTQCSHSRTQNTYVFTTTIFIYYCLSQNRHGNASNWPAPLTSTVICKVH